MSSTKKQKIKQKIKKNLFFSAPESLLNFPIRITPTNTTKSRTQQQKNNNKNNKDKNNKNKCNKTKLRIHLIIHPNRYQVHRPQ